MCVPLPLGAGVVSKSSSLVRVSLPSRAWRGGRVVGGAGGTPTNPTVPINSTTWVRAVGDDRTDRWTGGGRRRRGLRASRLGCGGHWARRALQASRGQREPRPGRPRRDDQDLEACGLTLVALPLVPCACVTRCLQVSRGAVEEETERRAQVPAAHSLLGVPPAVGGAPRVAPDSPGQGASSRLQGQAGLCDLPLPRAPRWPQAHHLQGYRLRKACDAGCEPAQVVRPD